MYIIPNCKIKICHEHTAGVRFLFFATDDDQKQNLSTDYVIQSTLVNANQMGPRETSLKKQRFALNVEK